jgi:cytochrome c556
MKRLYRVGVAAVLATVSVAALSQGAPAGAGPAGPPNPAAQAKTAIETRQGLFKLMANQNGPITAMLLRNQRELDAAVVQRNAERMQMLAGMIPELFTLDTRQFKDTKTAALDGIWASQADFKAKADAMANYAGALAAAAKSGDKEAMRKAAQDMGPKGCGGCHDNYRAKP